MALFRVLLVLFGIAIVACAAIYLFTGDRRYLRWAGRLFLAGIVAALLFFSVLLIERLVA